ncbi:MAG: phosphatidate cytidylyltransferase, partial [Mycobacteriaceae bacterium]|nr:phosphatidate cytidylyltransferase [Mycobacteriaceae bacterium]
MTAQRSKSVADTDTGPSGEAPKTSRAGRNLPAAIAVGALMGGILIVILVFAPYGWLGVLAVAAPLATHEVTRRFREAGYSVPIIPLLIGGQAIIWLTWPFGAAGALGGFAGTVVVCMIWRLVGQGLSHAPVNYFRDISMTVFLATWVPLFMSFGALLIYQDHGAGRVFCLMLTVVCSDIGGYTAGVLFGKHLMVP